MDTVFSSTRRLVIGGLVATCALAGAANAAVITTVTYSPNGLPAATGPVNSLDFTGHVGQTTPFTLNSGANAVTVTSGNGGTVVQGSVANQYAAPVSGGTQANPIYVTAPYLSTGGTPGSITLSFATPESYLGLLWGSIGAGDLLTFYDASNVAIATVTGTQAMNAAAGFNGANGAQGFGGSQYTLVNLTGGQFSSVTLSQTGGPSFEAANFQYAATNVAVPEPASIALLGAGLLGLGAFRRRKAG